MTSPLSNTLTNLHGCLAKAILIPHFISVQSLIRVVVGMCLLNAIECFELCDIAFLSVRQAIQWIFVEGFY